MPFSERNVLEEGVEMNEQFLFCLEIVRCAARGDCEVKHLEKASFFNVIMILVLSTSIPSKSSMSKSGCCTRKILLNTNQIAEGEFCCHLACLLSSFTPLSCQGRFEAKGVRGDVVNIEEALGVRQLRESFLVVRILM